MKKLIFLFLSTIFIFSCSKKDSTPACTKSAASISGSYKLTAATYKADASSPEQDALILIAPEACDRDNIFMFQTNGTYQLKDAGVVCSPPGDDNGIWSVSGNTMTVDGDDLSIEIFDCKTLVLVNADTQTSGDKFKITLTRE